MPAVVKLLPLPVAWLDFVPDTPLLIVTGILTTIVPPAFNVIPEVKRLVLLTPS